MCSPHTAHKPLYQLCMHLLTPSHTLRTRTLATRTLTDSTRMLAHFYNSTCLMPHAQACTWFLRADSTRGVRRTVRKSLSLPRVRGHCFDPSALTLSRYTLLPSAASVWLVHSLAYYLASPCAHMPCSLLHTHFTHLAPQGVQRLRQSLNRSRRAPRQSAKDTLC